MAFQNDQDWQSTKKTVLERSCYMFNNPLMSDIKFTCGESKRMYFYAHKYVLATCSAVFYAMFYGDLAGKNSVLHLLDAEEESLEEFLRFLYTDQCTLTPENAIKVMYLAKKYMITSLAQKCTEAIENCITPENAFAVLESAIQFDEKELETKCWDIVHLYTNEAVTSQHFNYISKGTLDSLLKCDTLNINESELFKAVLKWCDHECSKNHLKATSENRRAVLGDALYQIRLLSMSQKEFTQCVSSSELLTAEEMIPLYQKFNGLETPALECSLFNRHARQHNLQQIRFARFSLTNVVPSSIFFMQKDAISFTVSKRVIFHGVRLFGGKVGSGHEVSLEVNGVKLSGSYISDDVEKCGCGFDVMLPTPIVVDQHNIVTMVAGVTWNCRRGKNGKRSVEVDGITVTFIDAPPTYVNTGDTNTTEGQFHQVILTKCI